MPLILFTTWLHLLTNQKQKKMATTMGHITRDHSTGKILDGTGFRSVAANDRGPNVDEPEAAAAGKGGGRGSDELGNGLATGRWLLSSCW